MPADWQLRRPADAGAVEDDLLDVYVRDAFNRFARKADVLLNDPDGVKLGTYFKGTPIELYVDNGAGWELRWGGFVINPQTGANETMLECYGHDLWLRKRDVFRSYTDQTISYILEDLITDLTPLVWDATLVNIQNDATVSVDWKGQQLDEVIQELATMSRSEEFGATNDQKFYFRPRNTRSSPRDFVVGEYIDAKFSDDGKKEINRVTVYYGEGTSAGAVTVEDRESQERLKNRMGAPRNVVFEVTKTYPEITTESAARQKAQDILNGRTSIRTGTIETWDAFDVHPGDVTHVEVPDQGVDEDMRVAQIEYEWLEDKTTVRLAENDEGVVDALVRLSEEVERIESRDADTSVTITQFLRFDSPLDLDATKLVAWKRPVPDTMFHTGEYKGNLGDPDIGGGYLGDQTGARTKLFEV